MKKHTQIASNKEHASDDVCHMKQHGLSHNPTVKVQCMLSALQISTQLVNLS